VQCDRTGCLYRHGSARVALVQRAEALHEDCRRTDIVIARMPVRGQCDARLIIDRFDLAKKGAHAVWIGKAGDFRVETVADRRGQRPWTAKCGLRSWWPTW